MEDWLSERGWEIFCTRFFAGESPPPVDEVDFLIAMGGPMSINDEAALPWLVTEKQFIRAYLATGRPMLGVCLGAQLMAGALGARVAPQAEREIGWLPIQGVANGGDVFAFPPEVTVFHWHGEAFDLPAGSVLLARSEGCAHQAFQIGERAIGLQFHLETTSASACALCENCRDELTPGPWVQSEQTILDAPKETYAANHQLLDALLTYLTR